MRITRKRLTINLIMYVLIATTTGSIVYLRQNTVHHLAINQQKRDADQMAQTYRGHIIQLSQYINSQKSRIQHLSEDNKRLSETGAQLIAKYEDRSINRDERRQTVDTLQQELTNLDSDIIAKYHTYVIQQDTCGELKIACKKGSSKSKKCEDYQASLDILDGISMQLKYLKARRESLISNIERNALAI